MRDHIPPVIDNALSPAYEISDKLIAELGVSKTIGVIPTDAVLSATAKSINAYITPLCAPLAKGLAASTICGIADGVRHVRIIANANNTPSMQRWAIFHELGYLLTTSDFDKLLHVSGKALGHPLKDEVLLPTEALQIGPLHIHEQLANIVALRMLMPTEGFYTAMRIWDSFEEIGARFGVSQAAAIARLMFPEGGKLHV